MRPASILRFEKAFLASILLGLVSLALSWGAVTDTLNDPAAQAAGLGPDFLIGTFVVSTVISLLLWYFIARRASNIAKWIFVVIVVLGAISFLMSLGNPAMAGMSLILGLINLALQLYAAWQLFQPDAKAWLDSKGRDGSADPAVFD